MLEFKSDIYHVEMDVLCKKHVAECSCMSFVPGAILEADCDAKSIAVRLATIISFSVGSVARTDAGSGNKTPIL